MALCRRALIRQGRNLHNVLAPAKPAIAQGLTSASEILCKSPGRAFSSLLTKWQESRVSRAGQDSRLSKCGHSQNMEAFSAHYLLCHHQQSLEAFSVQQVRHVYVEVIDNDLDAAIKIYKRKMNICKIEEKLKEKRYYSKPSERRKLAKHYKKLNRARRELGAKIRTVNHRMEKIQEVRKIEKEEKRAKAAAAAAAAAAEEAKASHSSG